MGFIDNIKSAFAQTPAVPSVKYGTTKEWFLSDVGRKALCETKTTVELTDYTYHYLKSIIANKKLLEDEDLYRLAFVFADSIVNSNQSYAGKESLLNENEQAIRDDIHNKFLLFLYRSFLLVRQSHCRYRKIELQAH